MYWINRKVLTEVLRNPFNPKEKIKKTKANEIFEEIYDMYHQEYENNWIKGSLPLEYFIDKYCKRTGLNKKELKESFIDYLNK